MTISSKTLSARSITSMFIWIFSLASLIRLLAMFCFPLRDPSEARYAEIARKMVMSGDWITLFHSDGMPFWAKPPLSTWLSAMGMSLFGIHAFAARLPIFLVAMGTIWLVMRMARTRPQESLPKISALILLTSGAFYVISAAVMTDIPLTFATTLSMVAFWHTVRTEKSFLWKYLFFVGISLGLLSKGPVSLILIGFPTLLWSLKYLTLRELWQKFPWIVGMLLVIALAAPWYILAELKTPGFLNYFFMGEHLGRFLVKDWPGDLYGHAHADHRGRIWVYFLLTTLPWSLWGIGIAAFHIRKWRTVIQDDWCVYLLLWTFTSTLLFTFTRNIILTYTLPSIPAFSLLIGYYYITKGGIAWIRRAFIMSCLVLPSLFFITIVYFQFDNSIIISQKNLIEMFKKTYTNTQDKLIYYHPHHHPFYYSAEFYGNGIVRSIKKVEDLQHILETEGDIFIAMNAKTFSALPQQMKNVLHPLEISEEDVTIYKKTNTLPI